MNGRAESLYNAAAEGDTQSLQELLQDKWLLDRVSFTCPNKTPLHVATMHGHVDFVREILGRNPRLAEELDSQQSSALHVASAKGCVETVRLLLAAAPDMCLSRDCQGRNPVHLAAVKGHVQVLEELVRVAPAAALEKEDRGRTVLHLCLQHEQVQAFENLLPMLKDIVDAKDGDGDTILHMAVRNQRTEIVWNLVVNFRMDAYDRNSRGQTPLDAAEGIPISRRVPEIRTILLTGRGRSKSYMSSAHEWLDKRRDAYTVVAVLIATMAFQAALTPPGGAWQEDSNGSPVQNPHRAGEAVMASSFPKAYKLFLVSNTMAFGASLGSILFMGTRTEKPALSFIFENPIQMDLFTRCLIGSSEISIAVSFFTASFVFSPTNGSKQLMRAFLDNGRGLVVYCCTILFIYIGTLTRIIFFFLRVRRVRR